MNHFLKYCLMGVGATYLIHEDLIQMVTKEVCHFAYVSITCNEVCCSWQCPSPKLHEARQNVGTDWEGLVNPTIVDKLLDASHTHGLNSMLFSWT